MIKKILSAALIVCMIFSAAANFTAFGAVSDNAAEHTPCYALIEVSTGTVVFDRDCERRVHMGSFNKLMTVLLTAEAIDRGELSFDTRLTCSEYANSMQDAQIWLDVGEKITVEELLKAVIIGNANDAAAVLAEGVSGSEDNFVKLMNSRAAEIGMTNTCFTNSNGYYEDNLQYTTAYDAALLLCELAEYDFLTDIFTQRLDEVREGKASLVTTNTLCHSYNGSVGFKCGSGPNSGCFAAEGARRDGLCFAAAVLDCEDEDYALSLSKELLDSAFAGYTVTELFIPDDMPDAIPLETGVGEQIRIAVENPGFALIKKSRSDDVTARIILPDYVYAPVEKGSVLGELRFMIDDTVIKTCRITAAEYAESKNVKNTLSEILKNMLKF
ncbi:MAG: D-alanyl-D-alanine carboxypeptidase [Oscillospiraceae bacterium]|nr:D-alanyl-D-alanine carboxypeptidase [Oscillospiraceae bacterium]